MARKRNPWHEENETLCTAEWLQNSLDRVDTGRPDYRLLEIDDDTEEYEQWHIPGAVSIDWENDLIDGVGDGVVDRREFESLLADLGVTPETTVILYGDKANWFAAHGYWVLKYYGHESVKLLDGGRRYWDMQGLEKTTEVPEYTSQEYTITDVDDSLRAHKDEVVEATETERSIIDVRNPQEYRGEKPPADIHDTTEREGHIPTAENIPWGEAVNMDGTFRRPEELREVYGEFLDDTAIAYCRIGERSSITWFVLNELLDSDAANYDGSWTEWASDGERSVETAAGGDD